MKQAGINEDGSIPKVDRAAFGHIIAVKLASSGYMVPSQAKEMMTEEEEEVGSILQLASGIFQRYAEQSRLLHGHLVPPDQRIQDYLNDALKSTGELVKLPEHTLFLDSYGIARELSLPSDKNIHEFHNDQ
eukprot:7296312-Ditylum_brightwellii.AAC.1